MDLKTFGQAIRELAEEKGVPEEKVVATIELAIAAAYKKDYGKRGQIIRARFNPQTGNLSFSQIKIVVDESMIKSEEEIAAEEEAHLQSEGIAHTDRRRRGRQDADDAMEDLGGAEIKKVRFNPERHIMLDEARDTKQDAALGEELEFPLETHQDFGRIASQTAKQVIIQRIREAEREATFDEYKGKEGEIVSGLVQRIEGRNIFVDLGRGVGILPPEEQIQRERYSIGERLKALLIIVEKDSRGPGMILSRSHPRFLKKLFELEVPEIASGSVEIKTIAREAGSRSKVAVASNEAAIDPVGSMVGQRGVRVSAVMNEIGGEKIDIIEWSDDPARFIGNSLSPAKVLDVLLHEDRREATVVAADDQLSLAIGKGGQNVRLAAKLTGWKIDVRSASRPEETEDTSETAAEAAAADTSQEHSAEADDGSRKAPAEAVALGTGANAAEVPEVTPAKKPASSRKKKTKAAPQEDS